MSRRWSSPFSSPDLGSRDPRIELLEAILDATKVLMLATGRLRRRPDVLEATHTVDLQKHLSGYACDEYVEATLANGAVLTWAVSLTWPRDTWHIDAEVAVNRTEYQERLIRIYDADIVDRDITEALREVAQSIQLSIDSSDLTQLSEASSI